MMPICLKQESEIEENLEKLKKSKKDFDTATERVISQMRHQHEKVKLQLNNYIEEQITTITNTKKNQLTKIEEQVTNLQHLSQQRKDFKEKGKELLKRAGTLKFLSDSSVFLSQNQLTDLPQDFKNISTFKLQPQYKCPSSWQTVETEEFNNLIQEHILGYFELEEDKGSRVEVEDQMGSMNMRFRAGNVQDSHFSLLSQTSRRSRSVDSLPYSSTGSLTDFSRFHKNRGFKPYGSFRSLFGELTYKRSEPSLTEDAPTRAPISGDISVEELYHTSKSPSGTYLKLFHDALFTEESMWISGWTKNTFTKNETVLANVHGPKYKVMVKENKPDEYAHVPTMMILQGEYIFFAKKGGKEIFSFNTHSHIFGQKYTNDESSTEAMCASKDRLFVKTQDFIRVFDFRFNPTNHIPLLNDDTSDLDIDMCYVDRGHQGASAATDVILYSKSAPNAYVRAVNTVGDVVWQIDCRNITDLDSSFDPCSISTLAAGDVLIDDRGTYKVIFFL